MRRLQVFRIDSEWCLAYYESILFRDLTFSNNPEYLLKLSDFLNVCLAICVGTEVVFSKTKRVLVGLFWV